MILNLNTCQLNIPPSSGEVKMKKYGQWLAQLVERSVPIPEVHGLNPVIGKIYLY